MLITRDCYRNSGVLSGQLAGVKVLVFKLGKDKGVIPSRCVNILRLKEYVYVGIVFLPIITQRE